MTETPEIEIFIQIGQLRILWSGTGKKDKHHKPIIKALNSPGDNVADLNLFRLETSSTSPQKVIL